MPHISGTGGWPTGPVSTDTSAQFSCTRGTEVKTVELGLFIVGSVLLPDVDELDTLEVVATVPSDWSHTILHQPSSEDYPTHLTVNSGGSSGNVVTVHIAPVSTFDLSTMGDHYRADALVVETDYDSVGTYDSSGLTITVDLEGS